MQRIKKIGVLSLAYTVAILYFIGGVFTSLLLIIGKKYPTMMSAVGLPLSDVNYLLILVIYPFLYAIAGFLVGAVVAWIYNATVGLTKGIEVELSQEVKSKK